MVAIFFRNRLLCSHKFNFIFAFNTLAKTTTKDSILVANTIFLQAVRIFAVTAFYVGIILNHRLESIFYTFLLFLNGFLTFFLIFRLIMALFTFTFWLTVKTSCKTIAISFQAFAISAIAWLCFVWRFFNRITFTWIILIYWFILNLFLSNLIILLLF